MFLWKPACGLFKIQYVIITISIFHCSHSATFTTVVPLDIFQFFFV